MNRPISGVTFDRPEWRARRWCSPGFLDRLLQLGQQRLTGYETAASAVSQEAPAPAREHDDAIGEADQIDQVDAQPQHPGRKAAGLPERAQPWNIGHARKPADDRHVTSIAVVERLDGLAAQAPPDGARGIAPALDRALRHARHNLLVKPCHSRRVTNHEDFRVIGQVQLGVTTTRPLRSVTAPVALARRRAKLEASTPAAQSTVACRRPRPPAILLDIDAVLVDADDLGVRLNRHTKPFELAPR
jgi:hypothetical protein